MTALKGLFVCVLGLAIAVPMATAQKAPAMTNDDVIGLASAGMGDDIIVAKIHAAPSTAFDTSVAGLKALKAAGVSTTVIRVMIDPSLPAVAAPVVKVDPDDPLTSHSGFYMQTTGPDGKMHLEKLLTTTISGVKGPNVGSVLGSAYSLGIHKAKVKMIIPGTKADVQTSNLSPTFWIYPGDMSIQNTELVKLEVKKATRETTGASIGLFSGVSAGGTQGHGQGLTIEKVKDGVYKVTTSQALAPGSYAFIQGSGGVYHDFDIVAAP